MVMVMVMIVRAVGTVAGMMREAARGEVTSGEDDKWQELKAENSPFHHGRWVGGTFQSKWYKSPTRKTLREAQTGKTNPWKWLNFSQELSWKPFPSRENICKWWDSAVLHWQLHQFWGLQVGPWIISIIVTAAIIFPIFTKPCNVSNHSVPLPRNSDIYFGKGCKTEMTEIILHPTLHPDQRIKISFMHAIPTTWKHTNLFWILKMTWREANYSAPPEGPHFMPSRTSKIEPSCIPMGLKTSSGCSTIVWWMGWMNGWDWISRWGEV